MASAEIREIVALLARAPEDLGLWSRLAILATRLGPGASAPVLGEVLAEPRAFPGLLAALAALPQDEALCELALSAMGLVPVTPRSPRPGSFWWESGRVGDGGGRWYDRETGLALEAFHPVSGEPLQLVAAGPALASADAPRVSAFWMGRYPRTTGNEAVPGRGANLHGRAPTWSEARAWLALRDARLPTEAEWARAAGAADGRPYPWGWSEPAPSTTHAAVAPGMLFGTTVDRSLFPPGVAGEPGFDGPRNLPEGRSPFGVEAMLGWVEEWCLDAWSRTGPSSRPKLDPLGAGGPVRTLRGVTWDLGRPEEFRIDRRREAHPDSRPRLAGFRVVRSVVEIGQGARHRQEPRA